MKAPAYTDILQARNTIAPYLQPTPLYFYRGLSDLIGAEVWVKHENHQPVGVFKARGAINLIAHLSDEERKRGVICASTGNHGQSIAYAGMIFDVPVIVAMPEGSNPGKAAAIRHFGAEVRFHGRDFDETRAYVEELVESEGTRYISSGDEPQLISGVGTYALEILETLPDVEVIILPLGAGTGAAGACTVVKTVTSKIQVIAVQSENAPSACLSWKEGKRVEAKMETFAEGLATRAPFDLPQSIIRRLLDDFILVSDEEIKQAIIWMIEHTHNLTEGAGAAPLAGAVRVKERIRGKKVVLVQSGGNLSLEKLKMILASLNGPHR